MRITLTIITLLLIVGVSFGQYRNDLKGPAAKNYKSYKADKQESVVVTQETRNLLGPAAKNFNHAENPVDAEVASDVRYERPKLKGPAAKNYKHWQNKQSDETKKPVEATKEDGNDEVI